MQFCHPHWDSLKEAIKERGLWPYVSQGGEEVARRTVASLEDGDSKDTFDPLMGAHWAIVHNAMSMVDNPVYFFATDKCCPICESERGGGPEAEWWIKNSADEQKQKALAMGLL
jgi:hypothetical protein